MPNRILRDWTDSYTLEKVSAEGERLFVRLIMKADDFGRYHADPRLVRAGCFPLLENLRDTDITHWIAECETAGLIAVYQVSGRSYLTIRNFKQRTRVESSKFPPPDGKPNDWRPEAVNGVTVTCPSHDGQMTAKTYSETETEARAETARGAPPKDAGAGAGNGKGGARKFVSELKLQIEEAERQRKRLKEAGANETATGVEWHDETRRVQFLELGRKLKNWRNEMLAQ